MDWNAGYDITQNPDGSWSARPPLSVRVEERRAQRAAIVLKNEAPVRLAEGPKVVVHVLPHRAFANNPLIDVKSLHAARGNLSTVDGHFGRSRFNFDGYLTYTMATDTTAENYLQAFRDGCVESVGTRLIPADERDKWIPSLYFEKQLIEAVTRFIDLERTLRVDPPWAVLISLLGVEGYRMAVNSHWARDYGPIDRPSLLLPAVTIDAPETAAATVLRPTFDQIWQAAGWDGSPNYNEDGLWAPKS